MRIQKNNFTIGRRRFLQIAAGGLIYMTATRKQALAAQYVVGVGRNADGYDATNRALEASGDWNSTLLSGRTVLIKPNLVAALTADTGATTDPQVVRAIVDTALAAGAAQVKIIEGYPGGNNYESCGYGFFEEYDELGRVSLVNLESAPTKLVNVPNGLAYQQMYMPEMLFEADTILVSAAKMKVHAETLVTLSVKNVFGLSPEANYRVQAPDAVGRFAMHDRGVQQAIVDHNLVRPIDFAVVDGVWAMERTGPWGGDPVRFDTVVAGRNPVAVDRVCLAAMQIAQPSVHYLTLLSNKGGGPLDLTAVEIRGDGVDPRAFELPDIPPVIDLPIVSPATIYSPQNQSTTIRYGLDRASYTRIEIVKTSELSTAVVQVRLLQDWALRAAGNYEIVWDGLDEAGELVGAGTYTVRVEATHGETARNAFATNWVTVLDDASSNGAFQIEPSALTFVGVVDGQNPPTQSVIIGDFQGEPLAWNANSSSAWLQLSSTSGTTPSVAVAEVNSAGLDAGTYTAQATIIGSGQGYPQSISVKLVLYRELLQPGLADLMFTEPRGSSNPASASLTIANAGDEEIDWIVSQCPPWLTVSTTSGRGASEIDVTPALDGVAMGLYQDQLVIVNAATTAVVQNTSVQLKVGPYKLLLPRALRS